MFEFPSIFPENKALYLKLDPLFCYVVVFSQGR